MSYNWNTNLWALIRQSTARSLWRADEDLFRTFAQVATRNMRANLVSRGMSQERADDYDIEVKIKDSGFYVNLYRVDYNSYLGRHVDRQIGHVSFHYNPHGRGSQTHVVDELRNFRDDIIIQLLQYDANIDFVRQVQATHVQQVVLDATEDVLAQLMHMAGGGHEIKNLSATIKNIPKTIVDMLTAEIFNMVFLGTEILISKLAGNNNSSLDYNSLKEKYAEVYEKLRKHIENLLSEPDHVAIVDAMQVYIKKNPSFNIHGFISYRGYNGDNIKDTVPTKITLDDSKPIKTIEKHIDKNVGKKLQEPPLGKNLGEVRNLPISVGGGKIDKYYDKYMLYKQKYNELKGKLNK